MNSKSLLKWSSVIVLTIASVVVIFLWWAQHEPSKGGPFELNFNGASWKFSEHAKDLNILYVGYVKCPDVCPMSLSFTAQAFKKLSPDELGHVQLLFLSVDQAHDSAESVASYAALFFSGFTGLTGSKAQIDRTVDLVGASYMVEEDPKSHLGYSIAHTDRLFFLNKRGRVVETIQNPRSPELIVQTIRKLL